MAIRMQQRRGTASQWTSANPVLGSGEVGFETDTGRFRLGDGVSHWADLDHFSSYEELDAWINTQMLDLTASQHQYTDDAVLASSTATLDSAGTVAQGYAYDAEVAAKAYADEVSGVAKSGAETTASGYVSTHAAVTTNVHGISNTANLVTKAGTETLTNKTISAADNTVTINLADVIDVTATVSEVNKLAGLNTTKTELGYVNGVTSALQTQLDAKAPKADPTFTGTTTVNHLAIEGDLVFTGTATQIDQTNLAVTDSLIYLADQQYASDLLDIGIYGAYGSAGNNSSNHPHTGLIRDASDAKWKLISGGAEPVNNVVDFSAATYDTLKLGGIEFSDGTQVKQGVPSLTTINQQTASYTPVLTDRDKLIEVNSSSGVTLTIPTDASVAYPVGTSFDVLQTGTGQITIAGASGVTVNATPGLKLRTQWSSATIFKRASDTWVVYGDLTA